MPPRGGPGRLGVMLFPWQRFCSRRGHPGPGAHPGLPHPEGFSRSPRDAAPYASHPSQFIPVALRTGKAAAGRVSGQLPGATGLRRGDGCSLGGVRGVQGWGSPGCPAPELLLQRPRC